MTEHGIELTPIGRVEGGRESLADDRWADVEATIRLDEEQFEPGALDGIGEFSHLEVVYLLDRVDPASVERAARQPRGRPDWPSVGILAQRAKRRPNRLGVSRCRLLEVDGWSLCVADLDAVDGTPILDIKPHMEEFGPRGSVRQPDWSRELMEGYYETSEHGGELECHLLRAPSERELDVVAAFSMMTIWETCRAARRDPSVVPNFNYSAMKAMYRAAVDDDNYRFVVAEEADAIRGHAIWSRKRDDRDRRFGELFTLYVLPRWRRRGIARRLLEIGADWLAEVGVDYLRADAHRDNAPVRSLLTSHGFRVTGHRDDPWPTVRLRRRFEG